MITVLKSISTPIIWIIFLLVVSILLLRKENKQSRLKIGWYLLIAGACILYFLSIAPISNTLVYSLESQYQPPPKEDLETLDIIVILGGGIYPPDGLRKSPEASGTTYSRLFNGVKVFKQSSAKVLVLSGAGSVSNESEAEVMKNLAIMLGVPEDKIITETKSNNTLEQAIEIAELFPPSENKRIGIVTSALHMPRAVQAFQEKFPKKDIVPIPVGYISSSPEYSLNSFIPAADAFMTSTDAIHEEIGMIWYHFLAWGQ
ncbi:Uncharacterised protein [uncultured archaeon]|nr:Uncharacterised protein [uncultured archaeon]